jgi:hypothetical protein
LRRGRLGGHSAPPDRCEHERKTAICTEDIAMLQRIDQTHPGGLESKMFEMAPDTNMPDVVKMR